MVPSLLSSLAGFFLVAHLTTLWVAWRRCRPDAAASAASQDLPPVTVVRPLCGIETFSAQTLDAAFRLDYPSFELIFCVARDDDPILPLVEAAIVAHPEIKARLLVGDDVISRNPKLNNMVKGWREAAHDWIAFIDSNVTVTPDYMQRCVATWRADTGAVSAPPVGSHPSDAGGWLECAFLNTYAARFQYAVDTFGNGFAQGKTLFYRKSDLDRSGLRDLATEPAEDAATTKMVRRSGRRVRLAPPSPMPIGARSFAEVWSRQLRWARLRRATFPLEYLPEIAAGAFVPGLLAALAAWSLGWPVAGTLTAYLVIWFAAEIGLASACGWPGGWRLLLSLLVRDVLMPALFVGAFTARSYTWKGAAIRMEPRRPRRVVDAKALTSEEGIRAAARAFSRPSSDLRSAGPRSSPR